MKFSKATYFGNQFIGIFVRTSDKITIIPKDMPPKFKKACEEVLKTEVREISIAGSNLLGIFSTMNSSGIVVPQLIFKDEVSELKKLGLNVYVSKSKFTAIGNNILLNDNAAVVNSRFEEEEVKEIEDYLGLEVVARDVAGYSTVGAVCVVTNKGILAHNDSDDREMEELEKIFKVKGSFGTANLGVTFVGTSMVANSNGCVVGEDTSGFEMQRISEALDLI
ncbi:translation initiation factor IF-6 [Candidatus Micrarchaeota archaeon]|nr:translation initiation factor IF-6 [Candidatus Micrarchaeota archaeon]